jgi:hypothetical protein
MFTPTTMQGHLSTRYFSHLHLLSWVKKPTWEKVIVEKRLKAHVGPARCAAARA